MEDLVDQICDLMAEEMEAETWSMEARMNYQNEVLRRVRNELTAREEA